MPGDKSIGHRALLLAALAEGRSRVRGLGDGADNQRTLAALTALGVSWARGEDGLAIEGAGLDGLRPPALPIECGNSGTTMRLLAGVLAPRRFEATLDGDTYLRARPMGRVARPLTAMGARLRGEPGARPGELHAPLLIGPAPGALRGLDHHPEVASAQVKSAVLLAALLADGATRYHEPLRSRDHSERMLRAQGAPLVVEAAGAGARITLDPAGWGRRLAPLSFAVAGDLSSAAFLIGAAVLSPGAEVVLRAVGTNPTRAGVLEALRRMGADVSEHHGRLEGGEPIADLVVRGGPRGRLRALRIDGGLALRCIDELPLLAAVAAHADGDSVIADAAELRVKESDRIAATCAALRAMGVAAEERADGLAVRGGPVHGGTVESRGDHRIAMAAAVCATAAAGETVVEDTANVATSYPGFAAALRALGADVVEQAAA